MRTWIMAGLALASFGCGKDAEHLAQVCRLTGAKLEAATGNVRARVVNGVQAARGETGLDSRVATRLRWDKAMADAEVHVTSPEAGLIQLDGTVVSAQQQARAVELATATLGVEKVENNLVVRAQP